MRRISLASALACGLLLLCTLSALAENQPWLSASPPFGKAGDTVAFTVTGPPGYDAALAYSFSSRGAGQVSGQDLLLGDVNLLAQGAISSSGAWTSTVQIPSGLSGLVFLQAAVWPPAGGAMTLTNGIGLSIPMTGSGPVGVADLVLAKNYGCPSPTTPYGIGFWAYIGAFKPIREATMQGPVGPPQRMLPLIFKGPYIITPSGYAYIFGYEYRDEAGETNLGLFPDGAYTFTVTFADGTSTSISTTLSGGFPPPPTITSLSCSQTGVSRTPTIQFTPSGSGYYDITVGQFSVNDVVDIWRYSGTATSMAMPSNFLSPNTHHVVDVEAFAPSISAGRKSASFSIDFTTGP